jgi:hypothetical protein
MHRKRASRKKNMNGVLGTIALAVILIAVGVVIAKFSNIGLNTSSPQALAYSAGTGFLSNESSIIGLNYSSGLGINTSSLQDPFLCMDNFSFRLFAASPTYLKSLSQRNVNGSVNESSLLLVGVGALNDSINARVDAVNENASDCLSAVKGLLSNSSDFMYGLRYFSGRLGAVGEVDTLAGRWLSALNVSYTGSTSGLTLYYANVPFSNLVFSVMLLSPVQNSTFYKERLNNATIALVSGFRGYLHPGINATNTVGHTGKAVVPPGSAVTTTTTTTKTVAGTVKKK